MRSLLACYVVLFVSVVALAQEPKQITNSIGMKLVLVPKGTFMMGRQENNTQHEVTISQDYHLGIYEVTQSQYEKVMGVNPSHFQGAKIVGESANLPVDQVSWGDAVEFCKRLSDLPEEKKAGHAYRLPTEAEWEYACRAGSQTTYSFGESSLLLFDHAWFDRNSIGQTHPVGEKKPNAWGLYDMHGNVWELCSDWYSEYAKGSVTDPVGPKRGSIRVSRGGCWRIEYDLCASARRRKTEPADRHNSCGFRVVMGPSGIPR